MITTRIVKAHDTKAARKHTLSVLLAKLPVGQHILIEALTQHALSKDVSKARSLAKAMSTTLKWGKVYTSRGTHNRECIVTARAIQ